MFSSLRCLGVVLVIGCSSASGAGIRRGADSVYVGVAYSSDSGVGEAYVNGVRLALGAYNATRPTGAPPLAVRLPARNVGDIVIAAAFRDDPAVVSVVGHTGSAATMAAAPIDADAEHGGRHALLAITPTATNWWVTRTTHWVYRVCPTDNASARALARFAVDSMRAVRIALLYRDDLFGRGFSSAFADELAAHHLALLERDPYLHGITEYDAYAVRMARRNADLLVIAGSAPDAEDIVRAVRRAGSRVRVLGSDDLSALTAPSTAREFAGLRFTAFYDAGSASPVVRAFETAYRHQYGTPPDQRAALAYDAASLIGQAVRAAGADRTKVRDWIASAPPFAGVTGMIRFGAHGGDAVDKAVTIGEVVP